MFRLLELSLIFSWCSYNHDQIWRTRKVTGSFPVSSQRLPRHHKLQSLQILGKAPHAPSWPRNPGYQSHTTLQPALSYPARLWSFHHVSCLSGSTKLPSSKREASRGQYLLHTHLLIQSERQFYYLPCCLLTQTVTANQVNCPNQISSKCSFHIQHPDNRKFLLLHIYNQHKNRWTCVFQREKLVPVLAITTVLTLPCLGKFSSI